MAKTILYTSRPAPQAFPVFGGSMDTVDGGDKDEARGAGGEV